MLRPGVACGQLGWPPMKAYMYASPAGDEARLLSQCFSDFAELFRCGVLSDSSTVWVNAESPDPGFWALTDRSHYMYLHRTPVPGYARVTKRRIRWARNYDDTIAQPVVDLDMSKLTANPDAAVTLVVKHRLIQQEVNVINDKKVDYTGGIYTLRNLSVIDLNRYKPPAHPVASPSEFEQNDARYHGANHLLQHLDEKNQELIRKHLELFAFDISAEEIGTINAALDVVDTFAGTFSSKLLERLRERLS